MDVRFCRQLAGVDASSQHVNFVPRGDQNTRQHSNIGFRSAAIRAETLSVEDERGKPAYSFWREG